MWFQLNRNDLVSYHRKSTQNWQSFCSRSRQTLEGGIQAQASNPKLWRVRLQQILKYSCLISARPVQGLTQGTIF